MRKLLLLCFVACSEEPPPAEKKPAAPPIAAAPKPASQPASQPALEKVDAGPRVLTVEKDCSVDGVKAYVGQPIKPTSVIETKADSKLVFTIKPGGVVQVRPNARVELGKSEKKEWSLKLLAGAVWSFLPKATSFEVVGSNAVAGVRGTIFYVQATADNDTYICDCDGEVDVTVANKASTLKSKMQHKGVVVKGAKQKQEKKAINHTKDEAAVLDALAKGTTR